MFAREIIGDESGATLQDFMVLHHAVPLDQQQQRG